MKPLFTTVLGKSWSSITVNTSDNNADIYIDGIYYGTGSLSGKIIDPGSHEISISGTGVEEKTYPVVLEENSHLVIGADSDYEEEKLIAVKYFSRWCRYIL